MALWWSCCPDLCNLQSFWKQLCIRLGSKIYEHVSQRVETSQFSFQKIIGGITFHQQNWEQGKSRNGMELLPPCFFSEEIPEVPLPSEKDSHWTRRKCGFWFLKNQPLAATRVAASGCKVQPLEWPQVAASSCPFSRTGDRSGHGKCAAFSRSTHGKCSAFSGQTAISRGSFVSSFISRKLAGARLSFLFFRSNGVGQMHQRLINLEKRGGKGNNPW